MGGHTPITSSPKLGTWTPTIPGNDIGMLGDRFLSHGDREGQKLVGHLVNKNKI